MSQIGEPLRKVEYAPLEDPVPGKIPKEEPVYDPVINPAPTKVPKREKEPAPA